MKQFLKALSLISILSTLIILIIGVGFKTTVHAEEFSSANRILNEPENYEVNSRNQVHLAASSENGVTFEILVPWEQLLMEPVSVDGKSYLRAVLPGWSTQTLQGAPGLPFLTEMIGIPFGANPSIFVTPGKSHTQTLSEPILPTASSTLKPSTPQNQDDRDNTVLSYSIVEDPSIYNKEKFFPEVLATKTNDGIIRQQRVISIAAFPVQYNPVTEQLTIYESLLVEVSFSNPSTQLHQSTPIESNVYNDILSQMLLNFDSAKQWRQTSASYSDQYEIDDERSLPWEPPDPGWRINIEMEGLYKITFDDLIAAGFPDDDFDNILDLDPHTLKLFNLGEEVAISVHDESDDEFNLSDFILFYGQSITEKYTDENVYWLTFGGNPGSRISSRDGSPLGPTNTPTSFVKDKHIEINQYYESSVPGEDHLDRWLWGYFYPGENFTHQFSTFAPADGLGELTISLYSAISDDIIDPDHEVTIILNETLLGVETWDGITVKEVIVDVPSGLLKTAPEENILTVSCADTGMLFEFIFLDNFHLSYPSAFMTEGDELKFNFPNEDVSSSTWLYDIGGLNTENIIAFDVTNPWDIIEISGLDIMDNGSDFSVAFEDTIPPLSSLSYWVAGISTIRDDFTIEKDTPSNLGSPANGADHIVITHQDFLNEANQLRDHRAAQDLRAEVVEIQNIYDEFNYGIVGVEPIQDFLFHTYSSWPSPAPSYVVLLGDGHYDPKDYLSQGISGNINFIPPYLAFTDPWAGEAASDNRYVNLVGDDTFPDMMLGRMAVNTSEEASAIIDKIIAYEQASSPAGWQQQVMAVTDDSEPGGEFTAVSNDLMDNYMPSSYSAIKVHYKETHMEESEVNEAINAGFNSGKFIVNYIGHGGTNFWADEQFFKTSEILTLTNQDVLPVLLTMTCKNGKYTSPKFGFLYNSLAEVITRTPEVGAVASWSPTGEGVTVAHQFLDQGFFESVFFDSYGTVRLGQATFNGKLNLWSTGNYLELLDTFLLFGDPALRLFVENQNNIFIPMFFRAY